MDLFGPSGGATPSSNIDPKLAGGIVLTAVIAVFTGIGDQVAFVHPPHNFFEKAAGVIPELGYLVIGDRLYSDLAAFSVYAVVLIMIGMKLLKYYEYTYAKPRQIRRMEEERRLEERYLTKDREDHNDF
jgi:hypothetical protein